MRIIEMKFILEQNLPSFALEIENIDQHNQSVSNLKETTEAASKIRTTGLLKDKFDNIFIFLDKYYLSHSEKIILQKDIVIQAASNINQARSLLQTFLGVLSEAVTDQNINSISIRLPDSNDLSKTGQYLLDIDKHLSQLLTNDYLKGKISLLSFDNGSLWIDILIDSTIALSFFASLIDFIYKCRDREIALKAKEALLNDLISSVELRKQNRKHLMENIKKQNDDDFRKLLADHNIPEHDNEYIQRIDNSTNKFIEMLKDGLQIHPSLHVDLQATNSLPDPYKLIDTLKKLPSLESEKDSDKPQDN